jgi:hypothetical protein
MWDDLLLHISRMTDPPRSPPKENLSIHTLCPLVAAPMREQLESTISMAASESAFARDWRNRRIAHRDLALTLDEGAKPLEVASRERVRRALRTIGVTLNVVERHYFDATIAYDLSSQLTGADQLVNLLNRALAEERARRERLRSGKPRPEDLGPRDDI